MADIAKIILPNANVYNIKDSVARIKIEEILNNYSDSSKHVIASKTQPIGQSANDIWLIIKSK